MLGDYGESGLTRKGAGGGRGLGGQQPRRHRIAAAVVVGIFLGCGLSFLFPDGFIYSSHHSVHSTDSKVITTSCKYSERLNMLESDFAAASKENIELRKQIKELTEKLQTAQQWQDNAHKQHKAGQFDMVKGLQTNPMVTPDESANPRLAKILKGVAASCELIVVLANSNDYVKEALQLWLANIQRLGIGNYLVYALDDEIARFCEESNVPMYTGDERDHDRRFETIAKTGSNHEVSGLKFRILREFLQLGYSVLISDVDIVHLQNPFMYLYRDSDIESMTDGHDNMTAYGYDDMFDDPEMGWARAEHTMRIWVYNSGFFYIRPTIAAIELLDRVASRLAREDAWDQAVFNRELFIPSHPGYEGLHASRRTMDYYLFMNSKVLFKTVRKDPELRKLKPVVVHVNYHPDKYERMKAVIDYYVHGKQDALDSFPDGSE